MVSYESMDIGVDGILENKRGKQISQVLILAALQTHLDLQLVKPYDSIMHQHNEALDLLDHLVEQDLVVLRHGLVFAVHLEDGKVFYDGLLPCLNVLFQDCTEKVFEFDDGVVRHGGQMHPNHIELGGVLGLGRDGGDAQPNDIILHVVLQ